MAHYYILASQYFGANNMIWYIWIRIVQAVYSPAKKVLLVFVLGKLLAGLKKTLKLSVVNLNFDDTLIMFKASIQQGTDWLIGWAFV